jgi:thiosulfate/3-mercaptopyruvate sulfurtransferase
MDSLVSADWLEAHLGEPGLVVADASWFMPALGRSGRDEYLAAHIPGARFFDIDELSDRSSPVPHMLPDARDFGAAMERLGIGSGDRIIVYDNSPTRTAVRGWFMLRHFGAEKVAILDGGFQKWSAESRPVESGEPAARNAPLIIPPDFNLAPPVAGTAGLTPSEAQQQAIDALFGGPAPRSPGETSLLDVAGRSEAQVGIRSQVWDPETRVVDKGPTTLQILSAQNTSTNIASAQTGQ